MGRLYTTKIGKTAGRSIIKLDKGDPYYLRIIFNFATNEDFESDIPWQDNNFSLAKLCRWTQEWNVEYLNTLLGCPFIAQEKQSESIGYILRKAPSGHYPGNKAEFIIFCTAFNITVDNKLETSESGITVTINLNRDTYFKSFKITINPSYFNIFSRNGNDIEMRTHDKNILTEIKDTLSNDPNALKICVKRFKDYNHALKISYILSKFTLIDIATVLSWDSSDFNDDTSTEEKTDKLLKLLEDKYPSKGKEKITDQKYVNPISIIPALGYT